MVALGSASAEARLQNQKAPAQAPSLRRFGRFGLKRLLGRSSRSMAWLADDPHSRQEVMILMPRAALANAAAVQRALDRMRLAARLEHPRMRPPMEVASLGGWPFVVTERPRWGLTLHEWLQEQGRSTALTELAQRMSEMLDGMAYLHDAGLAHGDLGMHTLQFDRHGHLCLWGAALGVAGSEAGPASEISVGAERELRRDQIDQDIQAAGLLLYQMVAGRPALDEPDYPTAVARLHGEIVRLPWSLPQPVPDALRAIVNRAVDRHEQRRYLSARSLQRALDGWRQVASDGKAGPLALLLERLPLVGHLPALPGLSQRVALLVGSEAQHLLGMADLVTEDPALTFELLRQVNAARFGAREEGPVTTVRRAIALIGLRGIRRAATSLKPWPGPLDSTQARALEQGVRRALLAGYLAQALAPGGLDEQSLLVVAQLQFLGRLLVLYHFPDEAQQIDHLMQGTGEAPANPNSGMAPALSQEAAAMAVLGVDLPSLARALARHWGLGADMEEMMSPVTPRQATQHPDKADTWVRLLVSCAHEALDAVAQRPETAGKALAAVAQRYAKTLGSTPEGLRQAIEQARVRLQQHLLNKYRSQQKGESTQISQERR
jgi:HD-like signal output (HDOD) protein